MLTLDVNDKKLKAPICWEECTLEVFQRIFRECDDGDNLVKIFSAITGTKFKDIWADANEELDAAIYQVTAFVVNQKQDFRTKKLPTKIRISGKTVVIPKKLEALTIGQNFHVRGAISKEKKLEPCISIAIAVYLQPLIDEAPFDYDRALLLEKEILQMNIYDVFPIGFFLLKRLTNSGNSGVSFLLKKTLAKTKAMLSSLRRPALVSSNRLATYRLLTSMLRLMESSLVWFSTSHSMRLCHSYTYGKSRMNFNHALTS
jgi:hypothetical protein